MQILQCQISVGATSGKFKDISECHCCAQFNWLMLYYFIEWTNRVRATSFHQGFIPSLHFIPPKSFILFCSHPTHYFVSLIVEVIIDFSIHVSKYWYTPTIFCILVFYIFPRYLEYCNRNYKIKKLTKHLKTTAYVLGLHRGSNLNQISSMNKRNQERYVYAP